MVVDGRNGTERKSEFVAKTQQRNEFNLYQNLVQVQYIEKYQTSPIEKKKSVNVLPGCPSYRNHSENKGQGRSTDLAFVAAALVHHSISSMSFPGYYLHSQNPRRSFQKLPAVHIGVQQNVEAGHKDNHQPRHTWTQPS
jgi:hypothetical protein